MNVVQGLYRDFKIPAFLMEQRISNNPKLGHLPEIADRTAFGGQLVGPLRRLLWTGRTLAGSSMASKEPKPGRLYSSTRRPAFGLRGPGK